MDRSNIYYALFFVCASLGLYFFGHIIAIMAISYFIASLLDPIINFLNNKFFPRSLAVLSVFLLFWGVIISIIWALLPIIYDQMSIFITKMPIYNLHIQHSIIPTIENRLQQIHPNLALPVTKLIATIIDQLITYTLVSVSNIWRSAMAIVKLLIFFILLLVSNFYFLKDRDLIAKFTRKSISKLHKNVQKLIEDSTKILGNFIKGQLQVCALMSLYYYISLSSINLDFSLILSLISGALVAVPLIGILASSALSIIITLFKFSTDYHLIYVCIIYLIGNILEGYIITPKIIGEKIGLHPIIMIFAVVAWYSLLGIPGLLIGIPLTALAKTLIRNFNATQP